MNAYPTSKKIKADYTMHGQTISDDYAWLEDSANPEVIEWTRKQNRYTDTYFSHDETAMRYTRRIREGMSSDSFSDFSRVQDKYFWFEVKENEQVGALYYKQGIEGSPVKLLNLEGMRKDNAVSLDNWAVSRDAKYLAYAISVEGTELSVLNVLEIETRIELKDEITDTRYPGVAWLRDGDGFFYTCADKSKNLSKDELHMHQKIYLHKLGTDQTEDIMVFGKDSLREDSPNGLSVSMDGTKLFFSVSDRWDSNEVNIYDINSGKCTQVVGRVAKFGYLEVGEHLYMHTDYKAPNYRLLRVKIENMARLEDWEEIVGESDKALDSVSRTKSSLILQYIEDVTDVIYETDFEASNLKKIDLPEVGIAWTQTSMYFDDYFLSTTSMTTPKTMFLCDGVTGERKLLRSVKANFRPANFMVRKLWAISKDGTKVPMFMLARKDHDFTKPAKTIAYGYGGFNNIMWPGYSVTRLSWVEDGYIYVSTNIRGGGEYGSDWHEAGVKERKQNSFDDFIACCEKLIEDGVTTPEKLAISGASNGGLLVGAVSMQRPDLIGAVVCGVPLLDMYKFPHYLIASRWVHEFGDPDTKDDFGYIKKWSPYHLCNEGADYPAFYAYTGVNDTRVHPFHARKMAAKLQAGKSNRTVLLHVEMKGGHTNASSKEELAKDYARQLAFCRRELG